MLTPKNNNLHEELRTNTSRKHIFITVYCLKARRTTCLFRVMLGCFHTRGKPSRWSFLGSLKFNATCIVIKFNATCIVIMVSSSRRFERRLGACRHPPYCLPICCTLSRVTKSVYFKQWEPWSRSPLLTRKSSKQTGHTVYKLAVASRLCHN